VVKTHHNCGLHGQWKIQAETDCGSLSKLD